MTEDQEKALRSEYERAEKDYDEARERADAADEEADRRRERMEALGEKLAELEDAREEAKRKVTDAARHVQWLSERPSELAGLLHWLVRQPPPPGTDRIGAIVQNGAAVSNGWGMLHVEGAGLPLGAELQSVVPFDRLLTVPDSSKHMKVERSTLEAPLAPLLVLFGTHLDVELLRIYVLSPMIASGDASVVAWVCGPEDPVVFKGTGWTAVVMPVREKAPT